MKLKGWIRVSYRQELKELDAEIQEEIERRNSSKVGTGKPGGSLDALLSLRGQPILRVVQDLPFSSCLSRLRIAAGINLSSIAAALNQPLHLIEQLESNQVPPWAVPAVVIAEVAILFRLHLEAVELLTENSFRIALVSNGISNRDQDSSLIASWLADVRTTLLERNAEELVK